MEKEILEQIKKMPNMEKTRIALKRTFEILDESGKLLIEINKKDKRVADEIQVLIGTVIMLLEYQLYKLKTEEWKMRHARERAERNFRIWNEQRINNEREFELEDVFIEVSEGLYYLLAVNQENTNLLAWVDHLNKKDI